LSYARTRLTKLR